MSKINWDDSNPLFINPKFGLDLQGNAADGIPIPTYGNYGGPNISGPGDPVDALDALFKTHDEAIQNAMGDSETPGVPTPEELVQPHADLFDGIINSLPNFEGLILSDAEATFYGGFTILGLTGQLAQLGLLEELEVALDPSDIFVPFVFDDVSAALSYAQEAMETGLAELPPGEARSLNGLLSIFENQFEHYLIA